MASNKSKCESELQHALRLLKAMVDDGGMVDRAGFYSFVDEAVREMSTEGCNAKKSRARMISGAQDVLTFKQWQDIFSVKE